jgi:hypothetical protein
MTSFPNAGANEVKHGVQFASSGESVSGDNMEWIGTAGFEVRAARYDQLIDVEDFEPGDLGRALQITIQPPGPMLDGHALRLEAWRGAEQVPGGFLRAQQIRTGPGTGFRNHRIGIAFDDGRRGTQAVDIDRYPFTVRLLPLVTPGNYELRLFDQTTGLYVARKSIELRYPGPPELPERAEYGTGIAGDWAAENDPRRGLSAWYKPRSECADPEFDQPPKLEIVELIVNARGDDEFRATADIRAGQPIFVQATFGEAPPDDEYLVRVDGERRIAVYRSFEDPSLYRSAVLHFSEQVDE